MSPILLWTLVAIVGVLVYMWPVLQKEGFQNPYKTVQLANGATLTFQDADEWRAFQEITGGTLPEAKTETETTSQSSSSEGTLLKITKAEHIKAMEDLIQFGNRLLEAHKQKPSFVFRNPEEAKEILALLPDLVKSVETLLDLKAIYVTSNEELETYFDQMNMFTSKLSNMLGQMGELNFEQITANERLKLRQLISKIQTIRRFHIQNPSYKFKVKDSDEFVKDTIVRKKIDSAFQAILDNGVWGSSRDDKDLKTIVRNNVYTGLINDLVEEIEKYKALPNTDSRPLPDLDPQPALLTTADRVAIEILKKTLEDIQQRMAKNPTIPFQKPVQTNKLIQDISLLQYKLNEALQKGWGTARDDMDLKFAVQRNLLQTQYDAILKEIQEAEIKKTENDMKTMMESKTVPEECETTKSTPANCKITRQYIATPSEMQGQIARNTCKRPDKKAKCPEMKDYIHKSRLPDMSQYIRKDSIPCWACKL